MNEYGLHELLALLADEVGLTQPKGFLHNWNCQGQVADYGSYWQCETCSARLQKDMRSITYNTHQQLPSPAGRNFIMNKLGPPNSHQPPPLVHSVAVSPEMVRHALGLSEQGMEKLLDQVTRPEPANAIEHLDQDLRKYTERA